MVKGKENPGASAKTTPKTDPKKRKLEAIISPPGSDPPENNSDFISSFKHALLDEDVQKAFNIILGDAVKQEIQTLKARIKTLEKSIEDQYQYSRRTGLVISDVPESNDETGTDKIVLDSAEAMDVTLDPSEISCSHRLPLPTTNGTISTQTGPN
jgi:hypothetical protein